MNTIETKGSKETSATRSAYMSLREMILTGVLPAGQKLKIDSLRAMLDTGASPVREALSLLTSDMLVERMDQRGFRAAPASRKNFDEILTLRCALEDIALRGGIANTTAEWEERLVLAHHRMKQAASQGGDAFEDCHKAFHMMLLDNCDSPMLKKFCSQLYDLNIRYRYIAAKSEDYQTRDVSSEHDDIMDAVIQKDVERATSALLTHYRLTGAYLNTLLEEMEAL